MEPTAEVGSAAKPSPEWVAIEALLPDSVQTPGQFVYVDFWASWCPPCKKAFPWMSIMHSAFKREDLNIIAVCLDRDVSKGVRFVEESKAPFPIIYDPKGELAKLFEIGGMPTSFLFDRSRHIISKHTGFTENDGRLLEREWRELLQQSPTPGKGNQKP